MPLVAPAGTVADMLDAEFTVNALAAVVLNFTTLAPEKLAPVIVTVAPTAADVGENEVTVGAAPNAECVLIGHEYRARTPRNVRAFVSQPPILLFIYLP